MTDEIVLYQPDSTIQLEVRVQDDTVWLNRNQMAQLFDRDVKTIGKHINNALREELAPVGANFATTQNPTVAKNAIVPTSIQGGEKNATPYAEQNQVIAKFATTAADGKVYQVEYYSLDVILSVGYRVKSSRGIEFRRWANRILKEFVLRGYAVNQRLLHIENQLASQQKQLTDHQEKIDFFVRTSLPPVEQVFFKGEFFAARVIFEKIVKTATKRVIVIDEYIDAATFEMLDVRAKGVTADIYSNGLHATLRDAHNKTTGVEPIQTHKWRNASHDRWIIADDTLYHCGHSLKDTGNKLSCLDVITSISADVVLNYVR